MGTDLNGEKSIIQRITAFLKLNPGSSARQIKVGISAVNKTEVNSCLYARINKDFQKRGETPPLWWNLENPSVEQQSLEINTAANEEDLVDQEVELVSDNEITAIEEEDFSNEENDSIQPVKSAGQRFSLCVSCGQIIGSKGHCGCK